MFRPTVFDISLINKQESIRQKSVLVFFSFFEKQIYI